MIKEKKRQERAPEKKYSHTINLCQSKTKNLQMMIILIRLIIVLRLSKPINKLDLSK